MSRLKAAAPTNEPVSMLELFFDLVFVFSVTQLTVLIVGSDGWVGYARASLVLMVTWWMYIGYAWLANNVGPTTLSTRIPMLVAMACFRVMAIAVPDVFGSGAWLFAIAYVIVVLVHAFSFARSSLGGSSVAIRAILPINLGTALLLVAAAIIGEPWGWTCWVAACLLLASSIIRTGESGFALRTEHFVERHQLLVIIALGETIIATGISAQGQLDRIDVLAAVLLSMLLISCLWWVYFGSGDDALGAQSLHAVPDAFRTVVGMRGYSLTHMLHIGGLVLVAVGLHEVVHHPGHHLKWDVALTLSAGCALYLVAEVTFRALMMFGTVVWHLAAAAACLALSPVGVTVNGAIQLLALSVALLALLLISRSRASVHPSRFAGSASPARLPGPAGSSSSGSIDQASRPDPSTA